jgi:hypothetical protein
VEIYGWASLNKEILVFDCCKNAECYVIRKKYAEKRESGERYFYSNDSVWDIQMWKFFAGFMATWILNMSDNFLFPTCVAEVFLKSEIENDFFHFRVKSILQQKQKRINILIL